MDNKSLLPTLYLNENIPIRLIELLHSVNIEAIHTKTVNNNQASDEFQLLYATKHNYVLVSHNRRHFRRLHKQWMIEGKSHSGILVIGCGSPEYIADRIKRFFEQMYPTISTSFCESPPQ